MSRTAAQSFMSTISESQQMQQALSKELEQAPDPIAATSRFAQDHGFDVEPGDLKLGKARNGELADDDLEAVSGGTLSSSFSRNGIVIWMTPGLNSSLEEQGIIIVNS